jgi:hypothetical protein
VFQNKPPRKIFGLKREEVLGGWTKLHNEDLLNLNSLGNTSYMFKSKRMINSREMRKSHKEEKEEDRNLQNIKV